MDFMIWLGYSVASLNLINYKIYKNNNIREEVERFLLKVGGIETVATSMKRMKKSDAFSWRKAWIYSYDIQICGGGNPKTCY